jgi:hypothetical protein
MGPSALSMMLARISPPSKCSAASTTSTKRERTRASMVMSSTCRPFPRLHYTFTVRNRSKELVELLADVEKIRQERKKAKANRSKYVGTGNDGFSLGSSGGRYGGFGNDSLGGGGGGSYSGDYGTSASGYDRGMISPSPSRNHH